MKSLSSQALEVIGKNWGVSSQTREGKLQGVARFAEFVEQKFGLENLQNLKPGHVQAYAKSLQGQVSPRTGANYMSYVRDVCGAIGKPAICERENAAYGFGGVARQNPQQLNVEKVAEIRNTLSERADAGDRVAMMMLATADMRENFGLRHQEALMSHKVILINDKPFLVVEGAKGGRPRSIEVKTQGQRDALQRVAETANRLGNGNGRVIPPELTLKQARGAESRAWHQLGGTRSAKASMHISRHDYVQRAKASGATTEKINQDIGHGDGRSIGSYTQ